MDLALILAVVGRAQRFLQIEHGVFNLQGLSVPHQPVFTRREEPIMLRLFACLLCICISLPLLTCTPLIVPLDNIPQTTASPAASVPQTGALKFAFIQPPRERNVRVDSYSILEMRDAINAHSEPHVELVGEVGGLSLADGQLAEVPVILLLYPPQENEWEPLCRYLLDGGFFISSEGEARAIREALQAQGVEDFYTIQLTEDHPIFSAFYDLQKKTAAGEQNRIPALTGYFIQGRLAGVMPDGLLWSMARNYKDQAVLPARIKLVINLMAYALQQEGSLTWRHQHPEGMDSPAPPASIKK